MVCRQKEQPHAGCQPRKHYTTKHHLNHPIIIITHLGECTEGKVINYCLARFPSATATERQQLQQEEEKNRFVLCTKS
jgi:hypothetical protein